MTVEWDSVGLRLAASARNCSLCPACRMAQVVADLESMILPKYFNRQ